MRFLKLSLLLSTSFFLNFNNSWATGDEAEKELKNVRVSNNLEDKAERAIKKRELKQQVVHIVNKS